MVYVVMQKPVMLPYTCSVCGVGEGRREWFLDLGLQIDPMFNQAIYLCNECYQSMTITVSGLVHQFRREHDKWESGEAPTYSWMEQNYDVGKSQSVGPDFGTGEHQGFPATIVSGTDRDDQNSERDDSAPEPTDSGDANSVGDSDANGTSLSATFGSGELP